VLYRYGRETWSLTLREAHRLKLFQNRVQIFGPKRDEVTGEQTRLHNEEPSICTPHQILY